MKIAGMVLAFHVVFLSAAVLIQGCRATPSNAAPAPASPAETSNPTAPVSENWSSQSAGNYAPPAAVAPGYSVPDPVSPAVMPSEPLYGLTPAERARSTPTRPDNPAGFVFAAPDVPSAPSAPPAPTNHTVRNGESLWTIARKYNVTLAQLRRANPALKGDSIHAGLLLNLPKEAIAPVGMSPTSPTTSASTISDPAVSTYTVRAGDNLATIAGRNGTTVIALRQANNLTSDTIRPGQQLRIPGGISAPAPESSGAASPSAPAVPAGGSVTITMQSGDTLGEIARRYDVTVEALMAANNITNARRVPAGKVLVIPGYQAVGSGTIPRAAPANPPVSRPAVPSEPAPTPETLPPLPPPSDQFEQVVPVGPLEAPPIVPIDEPTPSP